MIINQISTVYDVLSALELNNQISSTIISAEIDFTRSNQSYSFVQLSSVCSKSYLDHFNYNNNDIDSTDTLRQQLAYLNTPSGRISFYLDVVKDRLMTFNDIALNFLTSNYDPILSVGKYQYSISTEIKTLPDKIYIDSGPHSIDVTNGEYKQLYNKMKSFIDMLSTHIFNVDSNSKTFIVSQMEVPEKNISSINGILELTSDVGVSFINLDNLKHICNNYVDFSSHNDIEDLFITQTKFKDIVLDNETDISAYRRQIRSTDYYYIIKDFCLKLSTIKLFSLSISKLVSVASTNFKLIAGSAHSTNSVADIDEKDPRLKPSWKTKYSWASEPYAKNQTVGITTSLADFTNEFSYSQNELQLIGFIRNTETKQNQNFIKNDIGNSNGVLSYNFEFFDDTYNILENIDIDSHLKTGQIMSKKSLLDLIDQIFNSWLMNIKKLEYKITICHINCHSNSFNFTSATGDSSGYVEIIEYVSHKSREKLGRINTYIENQLGNGDPNTQYSITVSSINKNISVRFSSDTTFQYEITKQVYGGTSGIEVQGYNHRSKGKKDKFRVTISTI